MRTRPIEPISVAVRRGPVTESVHRVHAVAVRDGEVVLAAGDPAFVTFMRSAAKPFQALPLARARDDLGERDLAIASASHRADPAQLEAVRALLQRAPAREEELECGPAGHPPARIKHNCSGKHAGMLALCRARGWRSEGYRLEAHRAQRAMLTEIARAVELEEDEIPTAVDGCGVVTFALSLERIAQAFSRLEQLEAGDRVAAAMRAHPELIRGPGDPDTELMRTRPGWTAKGGAEGLFCAAGPDGLGVAVKAEDGNPRGLRPAAGAFFAQLGVPLDGFDRVEMTNSRGEAVGEIVQAD